MVACGIIYFGDCNRNCSDIILLMATILFIRIGGLIKFAYIFYFGRKPTQTVVMYNTLRICFGSNVDDILLTFRNCKKKLVLCPRIFQSAVDIKPNTFVAFFLTGMGYLKILKAFSDSMIFYEKDAWILLC